MENIVAEQIFARTFPEASKGRMHWDGQVRAEARTVYAAFKAGYLLGKRKANT